MPFTLPKFDADSLKKELQPSALRSRAQAVNDRFSSPSSSSTGYAPRYNSPPTTSTTSRTTPPAPPPRQGTPAAASSSSTSIPSSPAQRDRGASPPPLPPVRRAAGTSANVATGDTYAHHPTLPGRSNASPVHGAPTGLNASKSSNPSSAPSDHVDAASSASKTIDWTNLTPNDKQSLFAALDGFFAGSTAPASALRLAPQTKAAQPPSAPPIKQTKQVVIADEDAPPPPPLWARPLSSAATATTQTDPTRAISYPPPCQTTSHAHDVALYFSSTASSRWTSSAWFTSSTITVPPILEGRTDMTWQASWSQRGSQKALTGVALFADLSVCWWKLEWDVNEERSPNLLQRVRREARYLDRPAAFSAEQLWDACATYGEQVAQFAEKAEREGVPIAHGECWDLASEGLASIEGLAAPIPSISRTHGHLIYCGAASGKDPKTDQRGFWRGGDTAVRRGDIVEWRKVRISMNQQGRKGWSDLGNPDHTAIIVQCYLSSDPQANTQPKDGDALRPAEVGILEVIEQSQGKPPTRAVYDLTGMESGELWVYRPVGMHSYLGIEELRPDFTQTSSRGGVHPVA